MNSIRQIVDDVALALKDPDLSQESPTPQQTDLTTITAKGILETRDDVVRDDLNIQAKMVDLLDDDAHRTTITIGDVDIDASENIS